MYVWVILVFKKALWEAFVIFSQSKHLTSAIVKLSDIANRFTYEDLLYLLFISFLFLHFT